jgi:hypothetical protein
VRPTNKINVVFLRDQHLLNSNRQQLPNKYIQ